MPTPPNILDPSIEFDLDGLSASCVDKIVRLRAGGQEIFLNGGMVIRLCSYLQMLGAAIIEQQDAEAERKRSGGRLQ